MQNAQQNEIPLSVPNLHMSILEKIEETIESGWVSTGGRFIAEFEHRIEAYTGAGGARAVQSGTAGLHLALLALGLLPEEEVLVPTLTFIAAVNPVRYIGAHPVFMDCDASLNMDPEKVKAFLENECVRRDGGVYNRRTGRRVRGMVVVHVFGNPADMEALTELAESYGLFVLEDASEALGSWIASGRFDGRHCGTMGDMGVFSFNANKIITSGGGGMVVASDPTLLERVAYLGVQAKTDGLRYVHNDIGYNYRMTNIAAAYGVDQMDHLEAFLEAKARNYRAYREALDTIDGVYLYPFSEGTRPNYWFYSLFIEEAFGMSLEATMQALMARKIHTRPVWKLNHTQRPYLDCQAYRIERAPELVRHILNIPCSTGLTEEERQRVVEAIRELSVSP